jgi:hypothetical protein
MEVIFAVFADDMNDGETISLMNWRCGNLFGRRFSEGT